MSLLPTIGAVDQDTGFYNGVATQSLRNEDGDSSYLYRTPSSAGNRRTFTYSCWYKRANLTTTQNQAFFSAGSSSSDFTMLYIDGTTDDLRWYDYDGSTDYGKAYDIFLRDTASWYHIVYAFDTTQATDSNRVKVYVNGIQQTVIGTDYGWMGQNYDTRVSDTKQQNIAKYTGNNQYIDGYLAEINFVDGSQLTADSFGETKNGVWIAKEYTGGYGTTGFRLPFASTDLNVSGGAVSDPRGSATNLPHNSIADGSGTGNHFTISGLSAIDFMIDSPENNFCTLNTLQMSNNDSNFNTSQGNLKLAVANNSGYRNCSATFSPMGIKGYFEFRISSANFYVGIIEDTTFPTNGDYADSSHQAVYLTQAGSVIDSGSVLRSASDFNLGTVGSGDIFGVAFDFTGTNRNLWFHRNNTYGTASGGVGNPATGANPIATSSHFDSANDFRFHFSTNTGGSAIELDFNFGQNPSFNGEITAGTATGSGSGVFKYAPPSGFVALCTEDLDEPTIGPNSATNTTDHFNTLIYDGNDDATRTFDVGFVSDFSWFKARNASGIGHQLYDSSRGVQKYVASNTADAEATNTEGVTDFDSSGNLAIGNSNFLNKSGRTHVVWNWKANGGTTSTNNDGDGTSTVQANTTSGFSIVTYTGSTNETYGHGLTQAPEMIWVKGRNVGHSWAVYHRRLDLIDDDTFVELNTDTTRQEGSNPRFLNGTTGDSIPTSTVFKVNHYSGSSTNASNNSDTYVAYCFHPVSGYCKIGVYIGNGLADGPYVHMGFRPAWILIKRVDTTEDWWIYDNKRDPDNPLVAILYANEANAEVTGTGDNIALDFTSNGAKFKTANVNWNASGGQYIYIAFAETPFKYSNAR